MLQSVATTVLQCLHHRKAAAGPAAAVAPAPGCAPLLCPWPSSRPKIAPRLGRGTKSTCRRWGWAWVTTTASHVAFPHTSRHASTQGLVYIHGLAQVFLGQLDACLADWLRQVTFDIGNLSTR